MGSRFSDKIFAILEHKVEDHNEKYSQKLTVARTDLLLASITDAEADQTFVPPLDGIE